MEIEVDGRLRVRAVDGWGDVTVDWQRSRASVEGADAEEGEIPVDGEGPCTN